ncbi:ferritin-like domain-containing protein [Bacillus vallismortis]|uniref:Ferritin-like domain-containing protein n=1 Tax=Bacillus vallismortis TaxID=72361 RepID=A0ABY4XZT7_BACVA|nr:MULTISPECIES: ferritin-like domain-containing protein [Bacillus]MBL3647389.1 ferritin-like domain-containing protein [Bacillus sp. RHFS10]MDM5303950.1 ferritin-like domain-containing protein [Bacillus subtilis]MDM5326003.1 ferritin-like domain-containing protein [Bacillus subtilis]USP95474.1 ferritin-like domain-containing protein [Bacillus vallismortis]
MSNQEAIEQIVYGLNLDLAWEYAAGIQYAQHASLLKGAAYFAVAEELQEHSQDEFGHAVVLNELIQYLGGIPTTQVAPVYTSMDNDEMLRQDLQGEYDAIRRYLQRIRQFEALGMYDSAQKIRNIAVTEQEHAIDLEMALGIEKKEIPAPKFSFHDK